MQLGTCDMYRAPKRPSSYGLYVFYLTYAFLLNFLLILIYTLGLWFVCVWFLRRLTCRHAVSPLTEYVAYKIDCGAIK